MESCWTKDMDQQVLEVVEQHFMQDLTVDDFEPLQRKLLVFKPQIY